MIKTWDELSFWQSDEWYWLDDWLKQWVSDGKHINPDRELLFAALDEVPFDKVKVVFVGQDPYPDRKFATGVAFSVGDYKAGPYPSTLDMIYKEYVNDLHYPYPTTGNLSHWCSEGVLLWNCIPSCFEGKSLSHNFHQWRPLTVEIIESLNARGVVFVFLGAVAREFKEHTKVPSCVIETAHPSPRGNRFSKQPFLGSRIFSRVNAELVSLNKPTVDWRLP